MHTELIEFTVLLFSTKFAAVLHTALMAEVDVVLPIICQSNINN